MPEIYPFRKPRSQPPQSPFRTLVIISLYSRQYFHSADYVTTERSHWRLLKHGMLQARNVFSVLICIITNAPITKCSFPGRRHLLADVPTTNLARDFFQ